MPTVTLVGPTRSPSSSAARSPTAIAASYRRKSKICTCPIRSFAATRAFSIYVYTFHAIILPAGRGEAQVQAYSQDLRERVLRALDRGDRPTEIARRFEVSRIGVYQVRGRE